MESKKYTLPREFAEKWIAALRTTEIPKVRLSMRNKEGCCANGIGALAMGMDLRDDDNIYISGRKMAYDPFVMLITLPLFQKIYSLNDDRNLHLTFPQIADWIIENVEFI